MVLENLEVTDYRDKRIPLQEERRPLLMKAPVTNFTNDPKRVQGYPDIEAALSMYLMGKTPLDVYIRFPLDSPDDTFLQMPDLVKLI